jgi:hypothetical protein
MDPAAQLQHLIDELRAILHVAKTQPNGGTNVIRFIALSALTRIGHATDEDANGV